MSTEQMRSEFEAWFKQEKLEMQSKGIPMIRIIRLHQGMWKAWQASRAALVLKLPETTDVVDWCCSTDVFEATKVFECLRAAGITVKE